MRRFPISVSFLQCCLVLYRPLSAKVRLRTTEHTAFRIFRLYLAIPTSGRETNTKFEIYVKKWSKTPKFRLNYFWPKCVFFEKNTNVGAFWTLALTVILHDCFTYLSRPLSSALTVLLNDCFTYLERVPPPLLLPHSLRYSPTLSPQLPTVAIRTDRKSAQPEAKTASPSSTFYRESGYRLNY